MIPRIPVSPINENNAAALFSLAAAEARRMSPPPLEGQGIVICGGGRHLVPAWVCVNMLRRSGCRMPVQLWHLGKEELPESTKPFFESLNVKCMDARMLQQRYPHQRLNGWEVKAYALLHSGFERAMLLDADNVPLFDPTEVFESQDFSDTGALFWPDRGKFTQTNAIWKLTGLPWRDEWEQESGQMAIDIRRHWQALLLCNWMNEQSEFWYSKIHGDKDTFRLSWMKLGESYAMQPRIHGGGFFFQSWRGKTGFQHGVKWSAGGNEETPTGYQFADECRQYARSLPATQVKMVWMPQWGCQNYSDEARSFSAKCPYCPYGYDKESKSLLYLNAKTASNVQAQYEDVLGFFRKNAAAIGRFLEISGGEPLLYPHLHRMLGEKGISHGWQWAITSNTLNTRMIEQIISECGGRIDGCVCWTASYHPLSGEDERFASNIRLIKAHCRNQIKATVVISRDTMPLLERATAFVRDLGIEIHYHLDTHGRDDPQQLKSLAEEMLGPIPAFAGDVPSPVLCNQNANLLSVGPDGSLYSCVTKAYQGMDRIAYVSDKLNIAELPWRLQKCDVACFACCDHVKHVERLNVPKRQYENLPLQDSHA